MDLSCYKNFITSRGLKYQYYFTPSVGSKPTLLFVHGFPSTSYEWRHQVAFFQKQGYGLVVPDTLGNGGTDKPKELALYTYSALTTDLIDILNAEKVNDVIAIGHDWGSIIVSRLASYYPDRFLAFGFLALGYIAPTPPVASDFRTLGYFLWFTQEDTDKIIESHASCFASLIYPYDADTWRTELCPVGATEAYILAEKQAPPASYLTATDAQKMKDTLLAGGLKGPLSYYRAALQIQPEDDKKVPKDNYTLNHPVFFGGAKRDHTCEIEPHKAMTSAYCKNLTIREFDTGHWLPHAAPDELNEELLGWIQGIKN